MRPKVFISVLLLSLGLGLGLLLLRPKAKLAGPNPEDALPAAGISSQPEKPSWSPTKVPADSLPIRNATATNSDPDAPTGAASWQEAYINQRVTELSDLGMMDDAELLSSILDELFNREPRIRKAAVEAAVQFKSPRAIPALKEAYAQAEDPREKINLERAIEFLTPDASVETNANPGP